MLARILKRMQQAQFVGAWNTWVEFVSEKRTEAVIIGRVMSRIMNRCITSAFETWVDLVCSMRGLRRLLTRMLQAQIASAFDSWVSHVAENKRTYIADHEHALFLADHHQTSWLNSCFDRWAGFALALRLSVLYEHCTFVSRPLDRVRKASNERTQRVVFWMWVDGVESLRRKHLANRARAFMGWNSSSGYHHHHHRHQRESSVVAGLPHGLPAAGLPSAAAEGEGNRRPHLCT